MASPNPTIAQMRSQLLQQGKTAGSDIAQAGETHVTKQEGPFFRVTPKSLGQGEVSTRGVREATEPQYQGAVPGAAGPTARRVPKSFSNEEIASLIKDPGNPALQIARQHTQEAHGKDFSTADISPSSLQKQSAIAATHMAAVNGSPEYKQAIFDAYAQQMPEVVSAVGAKNYDDLLEKSYRQLAKETSDQFNKMPVSMSFHRNGEGNYNGAKEMAGDVLGNRHLYVFQGGDKHDFLHHVDKHTGLNENEKFRAVHDFFGHAIHGNEFGPAGEEKAWNIHRQMYSPLAQLAMTAETRGQNSVVNYSPLNAELKSEVSKLRELQIEAKRRGDTKGYDMATKAIKDAFNGFQYAPQKAILLPPEFTKPEYEGGMPEYVQKLIKPKAGTEISSALTHFSNRPDLEYADPSKYGTGIKGAEAERLNEYPGAVRDRSYFYMGEPGEVNPEPGLGANRYRGESSSLYDITQDPLKLRTLAREANRVPYTAKYNQGMTYPMQEANDLERMVREYGYQGMANPKASKPMAIMFNQTPIQRQAKGGSVDPSLDAMKLALTQHGMYSPLEKATMGVNRTKGTPAEFMAEASKQPGFRKEEVADRRLQLPDQKLTKAEMLAHLQKSPMPKVTERELQDFGDEEDALQAASQAIYGQDYDEVYDDHRAREKVEAWVKKHSSKYQDYQLPGGKNYREVLLQTPHFGKSDEHRMMELEADKRRSPHPEYWGTDSSLARELRDLKARQASMGEQYHSSHWRGHPNVIAHMRLSDRMSPEGKKLLHIEEIQSDWHQEGRKKGYGRVNRNEYEVSQPNGQLLRSFRDKNEAEAYAKEHGAQVTEIPFTVNTGIPDAPFKKNWHELAIKHALHHAAKHGYHGVVITPGQEQADRYDLSKKISSIAYDPQEKLLDAWDHDRRKVLRREINDESQLGDYIGKEAASKLLQAQPVMGKHLLEGQDLSVGGEGMKGFYDKIVPDYLNKLGKPHGVKVGKTKIMTNEPTASYPIVNGVREQANHPAQHADVHHFPITEPMRQQILQGQPMYKQGGIIHKAEGGVVQPSIAQMRVAINQVKNPVDIQSVGVNEAPNMSPKLYMSPVQNETKYPAPGGVATPSGMPIGGIDQSQQQPGQQLMPGQPPQGPEGGLPGQPSQDGAPSAPADQQGPAQPMGNMLSMTPQGQAMQAMGGAPSGQPGAPPQSPPVGMAKGGSAKEALHFPPSPALMKHEIEAHAERMARQVAGLDNPNKKTIQQLAREQNLPLEITKGGKKQDVPVIDWEKQKGTYSIGMPGDPSRGGLVPASRNAKRFGMQSPKAGEYLKSIGGEKLESPVPMYGGKDYGAYGHPEGWASDLGASAGMFNIVKRLHEEDPTREIYGHYHKMSPESLNHAVHMMDAVLSHHRPHELPAEHISQLNHLMRNVATTTNKSDVRYPEFPGFENPNDVMFHGSLNSGMRKKIIGLLGKEKNLPGGKQKMDDIIYAISHPELRNIETGAGGSSILKFDPTRELRESVSSHPTYGHDIPSKLVGKSRYITPADILAPRSMHNAKQQIAAMGKKVLPFNMAKMSIIREPIDEQYVNQMGEYEHAMKKRLGYKKGGKVKLAPTQDTMQLALIKKKAK